MVPLLISAIGNILASLFWISLIVTFFLAIPLVILCVFEFILYAQASRLSPRELANKARSIAIAEIVLGLFLSSSGFRVRYHHFSEQRKTEDTYHGCTKTNCVFR